VLANFGTKWTRTGSRVLIHVKEAKFGKSQPKVAKDPVIKAKRFFSPGDAPSPAVAIVSDSKGLHTATKIFRRYPQSGLTAFSGGIRSASSIGTVVRSSAVVVGQRFERGVP
jgi:hypothetical protein